MGLFSDRYANDQPEDPGFDVSELRNKVTELDSENTRLKIQASADEAVFHARREALDSANAETIRLRAELERWKSAAGEYYQAAEKLQKDLEQRDLQIATLKQEFLASANDLGHARLKLQEAELQNQELQNEVGRLTRNEKCYGCGHSRENHDPGGCLVWVDADAHRKCLCKTWTETEKR